MGTKTKQGEHTPDGAMRAAKAIVDGIPKPLHLPNTKELTLDLAALIREKTAAPDLLAACEAAEQALVEVGCDCPVELGIDGEHLKACALGKLQQAIAKAKGK